jgi:hypothetical protein
MMQLIIERHRHETEITPRSGRKMSAQGRKLSALGYAGGYVRSERATDKASPGSIARSFSVAPSGQIVNHIIPRAESFRPLRGVVFGSLCSRRCRSIQLIAILTFAAFALKLLTLGL